ncbi:MAG: TraR/DksA C4-type zinc finger protein [Ardenticatenaceae bacterium]|nr:TraR/DksA C4-type zinc finger protein [Ardenticatenaceae bacterium]
MMTEGLKMATIQQMLEMERETLRQQLYLSGEVGRSESKNPDHMDIAQNYSDQERSQALHSLEQQHLARIEAALQAIAEGNYGRCQQCHQHIPLERLYILPYAIMCVQCQAQHD